MNSFNLCSDLILLSMLTLLLQAQVLKFSDDLTMDAEYFLKKFF